MPLLFILLFIIGLVVGSFLNVVIDREPRGESYLKGRSHCDYCSHQLFWIDLIPLFSFLLLNGKCRYCKKFIGYKYPLIELVTAILFVLAAYIIPFPYLSSNYLVALMFYLPVLSCLIVIFFTDLFYEIIPFKAVVFGSLFAIPLHLFVPLFPNISLLNYFLSGFFAFLSFLIIFLLTKGKGMGFGDVVYVFLMGLLLGFPKIILGFYIAFVGGAIISLLLIALKKKKIKGGTIPFGPFLVIATIIGLYWGEFLVNKILSYLV